MKAMKGKSRPELSWEVCSPKISILPPVYIKREEILREELWIERERERENTNLMMRKDPCPLRKRRANCIPIEDESRSSNTKISWWEGSSRFFFCTHLQNQSRKSKIGSKRERERERTQQTERTQPEWNFSGGLGDDHRSGGHPPSCGFWIWCVGLGGWGSWS